MSVAQEWQHEAAEPTLSSFLQEISLYSDQDALRGEGNLVTLMTLHNAKGLEFRAVYVIGMEEGVFPHSRSIEEQGIEEERRLAYVAMTRAMERLTLMHASSRTLWGSRGYNLPSRFLDELPEEHVERDRLRPSSWVGLRRPEAVRGRAARRRARPRDRRQRAARDARRGRRHPGRARRRRHRPLRRRVHRPPAHDRLRAPGEDRLSVEIRPCRDLDEFREALGGIGHYFGWVPDAESSERFSRNLALDRTYSIRLDGEPAGGGGVFPFELTVPGGRVRAGGVTVIGILPPYRRRGLLSALMRRQLDDMHERGEHVAYLWATDDRIYGRFGYGMASLTTWVDVPRDHSAFALPFEPRGRVRIVDLDEALERFPEVYERVAVRTPGMFARTPTWWETRVLRDSAEGREGGPHVRLVYEQDGGADGYAIYRIHAHWDNGLPDGHVNVIEALGATPEATAAIWRYLLDIDFLQFVRARLLPVDHELTFLLAEPRYLRARVGDGLWVRLVDVGRRSARARTPTSSR